MSIVIAGGAGFIGYTLAKRFLERQRHILVLDNFCRGRREFLESLNADSITIEEADLSDERQTHDILKNWHALHPVDAVWHMAANSDIPAGIEDAHVDLRDTFMTTFSLLQAMKRIGIGNFAFASSSAIYGDMGSDTPLREDMGPLLPISNYGAMKLASEAMISAAAESWLNRAWVFRFPNVVGTPATHGVILDFVRKLKATPGELQVLGNGTQQKAYVHVADLVDAMCFITEHAQEKVNVYNIGPSDSGCSVRQIAETVVRRVSPGAKIAYGTEGRGWVGDVPRFSYSVAKLAALGWNTSHGSVDAVARAVDEIATQEQA